MSLGDRRPDEHRALRGLDVPAGTGEAGDQSLAPPEVQLTHLVGVLRGLPQRDDRGDLDRLEGAVVEVGLELREGGDDVGAAEREAHAPAGHRVGLGQAVELDGAVESSVGGQHRRRLVAVESDIRVGEVVDEDELALEGQVDEPLHQLRSRDRSGRVVRERDDHDPRRGLRSVDRLLDPAHEVVRIDSRMHDRGAGEPRRDEVDGVGGARHDGAVASLEQHPHQVSEALLRTDRADDVHVGVEGDAELARIPLADGLTQVRQPAAGGVPVIHRLGRSLGELVDRDLRRRDIGIAETEIDHVATLSPKLTLQLVDGRENVRGEIVNSTKLQGSHHQGEYDHAG